MLVRHRIDDLEKSSKTRLRAASVCHRIDDLEKTRQILHPE